MEFRQEWEWEKERCAKEDCVGDVRSWTKEAGGVAGQHERSAARRAALNMGEEWKMPPGVNRDFERFVEGKQGG